MFPARSFIAILDITVISRSKAAFVPKSLEIDVKEDATWGEGVVKVEVVVVVVAAVVEVVVVEANGAVEAKSILGEGVRLGALAVFFLLSSILEASVT